MFNFILKKNQTSKYRKNLTSTKKYVNDKLTDLFKKKLIK